MMATNCANFESNCKSLLEQLVTARKEINNLRQQITSLRHVHQRDVNSIKRLVGSSTSGVDSFPDQGAAASTQACVTSAAAAAAAAAAADPSYSNSTDNHTDLTCRPIGVVSTWFPNKRATPRQPAVCSRAPGKLTLFKSTFTNPQHALQGLQEFSHMWILFHFHKNDAVHVRAKVAPPRLNGIRTGVFSTRSPHRPSPIGLSLVKITKIQDCTIFFEGVDMIDQTPVLDIKPYIPHYDNPLYVEKMLQNQDSKDPKRDTSPTSWDSPDGWLASSTNGADQESHHQLAQHGSSQLLLHALPISSSSSSSSASSAASTSSNSNAHVLRDQELAMRLQAQEFQENLHLDLDNDDASYLDDNELAAIIATRGNLDRIGFDTAAAEMRHQQDSNSRLLEGADGPNAVCGTDLDSIGRRALNLRLDDSSSSSSPIRMGVREAPDGEEGFTSSQPTVPQASNSANGSNNLDLVRQASDDAVRVPDWISRPKTTSVVFNERALLQLQEILHEKAQDERLAVESVLKQDPRSVYLRQRYGNQFYTFLIHDLHITCKFDDDKKKVTVFQVRHAGRTCDCGQPEWQCTGHGSLLTFNQD